MRRARIVIVGDHPITGLGLSQMIQQEADLEVVGFFDRGIALEKAEQLYVDVIMLDTTTFGERETIFVGSLAQAYNKARIVVLSQQEDRAAVQGLLNAPVSGYILKRSSTAEILRGLRSVGAGDIYVHGNVFRGLRRTETKQTKKAIAYESSLSERESTVLRRWAQGYCAKEIANQINVSPKSVETYKKRGMLKLGIESRSELVIYGYRKGWLEELRTASPSLQFKWA